MTLPSADILVKDPVFQLNVLLWALLPSTGGDYHAVLHQAGYLLHSVDRSLLLSSEAKARLASELGFDGPQPDMLAQHQADPTWLVLECKASSFGPESSTRTQAMKLLVSATDLAKSVGASQPIAGYLCYLTNGGQAEQLLNTLKALGDHLGSREVAAASVGTIGVEIESGAVVLLLHAGDEPPASLGDALASPRTVMSFGEGELPVPLYIIPWVPGQSKDSRLEEWELAQLAARALNEATARLGRMQVPDTIVLPASELLSAATYRVAQKWRDKGTVSQIESRLTTRLLEDLRKATDPDDVTRVANPQGVQVVVRSVKDQEKLIAALEKIDHFEALIGPEQRTFEFEVVQEDGGE